MENFSEEQTKILVVRPLGGLNDVLCQIEYARKISLKTRRRLAIQTETGNKDLAHKFGQNFGSIFEFVDGTSSPSQIELRGLLLSSKDVFPPQYGAPERLLEGSLEEITKGKHNRHKIKLGHHNSFDVIVHESWGGGILGVKLLKRIALNEDLLLKFQRELVDLPSKSTGIHFRNTDYKSERGALNDLVRRSRSSSPIVLASDDESVKEFLRTEHPNRKIFSVSDFIRSESNLTKTEMAVAQLLILAMCHDLIIVPLSKDHRAKFSGYSYLAKAIWSIRKLNMEGAIPFVLSVIRFVGPSTRVNPKELLRSLSPVALLQSLSMSSFILVQSFHPLGLYRQLIKCFRRG
jgi:hypothetical protein